MRILSFDIGIKNLAYCILDTDETTQTECYEHKTPMTQPITTHFPIQNSILENDETENKETENNETENKETLCDISPTIIYWDCINIIKEQPIPCSYKLQGKNICGKKSCLYVLRIPIQTETFSKKENVKNQKK